MELREFIQMGIEKAGSVKALGLAIGVHANSITNAKQHQRCLPLAACYKLADLIDAPRDAVAASSALVNEKDEKVREYLRPFAQNLGRAAGIFMTIAGIVMFPSAQTEAGEIRTMASENAIGLSKSDEAPAPQGFAAQGSRGICIM